MTDSLQDDAAPVEALTGLSRFRPEFHSRPTLRRDAPFEPADAVPCADGPVVPLPELTSQTERRRGHAATHGAPAPRTPGGAGSGRRRAAWTRRRRGRASSVAAYRRTGALIRPGVM